MSQTYRVSVSESASRVISVEDGICAELPLLDVLPREVMGELTAAELEERGFKRNGAKLTRKGDDGVTITIDVNERTVSAKIVNKEKAEVEGQREGSYDGDHTSETTAKARTREALQGDLEKKLDAKEEALRVKATKALEAALPNLQKELDSVANRVTAAALKQKAASLGEIEEITESANGDMTIKVRT